VQLFNLFNKFQLRRAMPKIFAHVLTEREMERFAAAVEMQKLARVYVSKCLAHNIRLYNLEQQRIANMKLIGPILATMMSRLYRGYTARTRVLRLERKRAQMR